MNRNLDLVMMNTTPSSSRTNYNTLMLQRRSDKLLSRKKTALLRILFFVSLSFFLVILFLGVNHLFASFYAKTTVSSRELTQSNNSYNVPLSYKYYKSIQVKEGDTLWDIASLHYTTEYKNINEYIEEIIRMNHLEGDKIHADAYIVIPYYEMSLLSDR